MKARWTAVGAGLCLSVALVARAQEKKVEPPKPGPEVEKMGYFVGALTSAGEMKQSPMGPGGPTSGRDACGWLPGKFFVACRIETKGPMGTVEAQGIMGYDPEKKVYTWWSFNSLGEAETATGTFQNATWTWSSDMKMGGKTMKSRYTMSDTTPTGYAFKAETSPDGKAWSPLMEGKVSKLERPARAPMPMPTPTMNK